MAGVREEIAQGAEAGTTGAYEQAASPDQVFMGLERYWRKRAEAASESAGAPRQGSGPRVS